MKRWLKRIAQPLVGRRLETPSAPLPPPPFLGGSHLGGRRRQLAAYQGWVFAAVNAIAQRVAGVPLRLYAQGGPNQGQEIAAHPVLDLLARPNPIMTRRQFRFTLVTHLELTGMAFVLVNSNALSRPAELWPLLPGDLMEIESGPDTGSPIRAYIFQGSGGKRLRYAPSEIIYLRHPSPTSLIYGASPIEAMAHAYDIDLAVRLYQRNFFRNSARPELVLATDQRLTEDEARRILTRWNQKHQGLDHAFEPTVLDGGLSVQPLSYSAKDFEFMALAGWTQDNILAAYGVPAGKLGLVKDVNRANALGIDITFNAECIKPRLDLLEDVLGGFLLPRYGGSLSLRHDNPVPSDRELAHNQAMAELDRGALTINEYRGMSGKPPVPWGDRPSASSGREDGGIAAGEARPGLKAALPPESGLTLPEETPRPKMLAACRQLAQAHYPRLLARFAGWSRAKVEAELAQNPSLLGVLVPAGTSEYESSYFKCYFGQCLARGLSLDQALAGLGALKGKED